GTQWNGALQSDTCLTDIGRLRWESTGVCVHEGSWRAERMPGVAHAFFQHDPVCRLHGSVHAFGSERFVHYKVGNAKRVVRGRLLGNNREGNGRATRS